MIKGVGRSVALLGECMLSCLPGHARSGDAAAGVEGLVLGMTIAEAREVIPLVPSASRDEAGWYEAAEPVEFVGEDYELALRFREDTLAQISPYRYVETTDNGCEYEFRTTYAALRTTYSESDQPPVYENFAFDWVMHPAQFTGRPPAWHPAGTGRRRPSCRTG